MKICYIISTCNKYLETRVQYQMETMFKNVNKEDIYYLTSRPNIEQRQFGWYTLDHQENVVCKLIYFIHNMNIPDYDWYVFMHDDTFIFENRLQNLLQNYQSNEPYYVGNELDHNKDKYCTYMSGEAGYALSKDLYARITSYIKKVGMNEAYYHVIHTELHESDLCLGLWVKEIAKEQEVNHVKHNDLFHNDLHTTEDHLSNAVSFHKVTSKELYDFYTCVAEKEPTEKYAPTEKKAPVEVECASVEAPTVFALVTDVNYFSKAKRTIMDLRSKGTWQGDIVLITIDFDLNANFKDFYNIIEVKFPQIDKTELLSKIGANGFSNSDKREIHKLNQWEKLHIFDDYFTKWSRVVFLDAGLRVLDNISYLLEINYKGKLIAPKDGKLYNHQEFDCQLSYDRPELIDELKNEFGEDSLKQSYFLNCIWIYDTSILKICNKDMLIDAMNKYTFCRTNEMGVMNIMFHLKHKLWTRLPIKASNGKILFDWCELNNSNTNWREYCYIKYPVTISFEDC